MEKKRYTGKDYIKIVVIGCIIVVPLFIAYYSAGYLEEGGAKFWSKWDCNQMIEFVQSSEFNGISEEQKKQYNLDIASCIEEP